jgi:hypothetical protein
VKGERCVGYSVFPEVHKARETENLTPRRQGAKQEEERWCFEQKEAKVAKFRIFGEGCLESCSGLFGGVLLS